MNFESILRLKSSFDKGYVSKFFQESNRISIGGFRIPLEELGGQCLGYSEIDKEAIKIYKKNFMKSSNSDETYLGDITKLNSEVSDLPVWLQNQQ